jgi:hypothetical protein
MRVGRSAANYRRQVPGSNLAVSRDGGIGGTGEMPRDAHINRDLGTGQPGKWRGWLGISVQPSHRCSCLQICDATDDGDCRPGRCC